MPPELNLKHKAYYDNIYVKNCQKTQKTTSTVNAEEHGAELKRLIAPEITGKSR
jgi:hypothetical protein